MIPHGGLLADVVAIQVLRSVSSPSPDASLVALHSKLMIWHEYKEVMGGSVPSSDRRPQRREKGNPRTFAERSTCWDSLIGLSPSLW